MDKVDDACVEAAGLSIHDLPDCPFALWYQMGLAPRVAARRAIKRAGGD